jgi:hypothetical protein
MAMYLRQRDAEDKVLTWIQDACLLLVDGDSLSSADSGNESMKEVLTMLEKQQDEWETVCPLSCTRCSAVPVLDPISARSVMLSGLEFKKCALSSPWKCMGSSFAEPATEYSLLMVLSECKTRATFLMWNLRTCCSLVPYPLVWRATKKLTHV